MMVHRNMERRDRIDSLCFAAVSEPAISRSDMADFVRVDPPQYGGRSGVAGALQSPDRLGRDIQAARLQRSEEHTSELQSLMRISYAVFCLKNKKDTNYTYDMQKQNAK